MQSHSPWYVVRTKGGRERETATMLSQRGVAVYLPILHKRRLRTGRRDWEPLFPGYLFASLEVPSHEWLVARSSPGVAYFLGQQGRPSPLPDGLVQDMVSRVEIANQETRVAAWQPGKRVVITQGPLKDLEAVFDRSLSAAGRVRVLVQVLSQLVPVELPDDYLGQIT